MLNKYFVSQSVVSDENKTLPQHVPLTHAPLDSITIHAEDVKDVLDNLNVTKSCGPDLVSPRLLKEGSHILSKPYSSLFNSSLQQGFFRLPGNSQMLHRFIKRMTDLYLLITDQFLFSVTMQRSWKDVFIKYYIIILMSISSSHPFSLASFKEILRYSSCC